MGWRGPYIDSGYSTAYINEEDDIVTTYDCFLDGWQSPLRVYEEGDDYAGPVLDLGFGTRPEDEDSYAALAGIIASPGANRTFDRMSGTLLDPNFQRYGGDPGGIFSSEGQDDDDVFVPIYKRDLWANVAPDMVIEALGEETAINTPVDIQLSYNTGSLPGGSVNDYVSGIAIIYPDPKQAPGFNVVELMGSGTPIDIISPTGQHIYKNSFSKIVTNQFVPVGYAFIYVRVVHHASDLELQAIQAQKTGFCRALEQRLGWNESGNMKVYGERVCIKNGISTISARFTLLGGG
jgi:hypothetical protein